MFPLHRGTRTDEGRVPTRTSGPSVNNIVVRDPWVGPLVLTIVISTPSVPGVGEVGGSDGVRSNCRRDIQRGSG